MLDDLSRLDAADIDGLPFGYIALAADGTIRKYNRYEADLARKNPQDVLGRNFFRDVAPCTQVQAFEGRFRAFVAGETSATEPANSGSLSFDFDFRFRHGSQRVRIGFVRTPLPDEIIVTVNRVRNLAVPLTGSLTGDALTGTLADATGSPVTVANADFWRATYELWRHLPGIRRADALFRLGHLWGTSHLRRVERLVQREHGLALREAELQLALECLSGSLAVVGLGRFEADFRQRDRGLVLLRHQGSPFARLFSDEQEPMCAPIAGLHAAFLGYLAGQALSAVELVCSREPGQPCLIAVGSEKRLSRLVDDAEGSPDAGLLAQLRGPASLSGMAP